MKIIVRNLLSVLAVRVSLLAFLAIAGVVSAQAQSVPIKGTVHPLVRESRDNGALPSSTPLHDIQLYLAPSAAQQRVLSQLLQDQRDPKSSQFGHKLSPSQFGAMFGVSSQNETRLNAWLASQGFTNVSLSNSRTVLTFSGNVQQVSKAFGTEIHSLTRDGVAHYANTTNISVPTAIADLVQSVRGLNDFRPASHTARQKITPLYTDTHGYHYIAPGDLATMYDMQSLYAAGITGEGVTAAVVGQTDINLNDIAAYRSGFGLPANTPTIVLASTSSDPGTVSGDLLEADLDLELLGAVARNAQLVYVNSTNAYTSLQYAIDQNLAQVISMSYGSCESDTPAFYQSLELLAEQANAEGITLLAASGDSGAADCDGSVAAAQNGLAVDSPASTPEFTAVGGTDFISSSSYFGSNNGSNGGSAVSYIPEQAWNNTAAYGVLTASGGGASSIYAKPAWQAGTGVPSDGVRDVPDVAFYALSATSGYVICTSGSCASGIPNPVVTGEVYGGTSASAPVFAGIVALLNNYLVTNGQIQTPGLGNINPRLYLLAEKTSDVFHDVTQGNNIVPCTTGTTGCTTGSFGYSAGQGYDQATGLGSVDAFNFLREWDTAAIDGTSLTLTSSSTSVVSGSPLTFTAHVTPASGSTLPTGPVTFYVNDALLGTATLDQTGTAAFTTSTFSLGSNAIQASYSGNLIFGQSLSPSLTVTALSPTVTVLTSSTTQATQGQVVTLSASVQGATQVPTGTITFYNGTSSIGSVSLVSGTATLQTSTLPLGTDALTASYSGSSVFGSSISQTVDVAVSTGTSSTPVGTTTTLTASSTTAIQGASVTFTAAVAPASGATLPTGLVTFVSGTTTLGSASLAGGSASIQVTTLPVGTDAVTATFQGTTTFSGSTSQAISIAVSQPAAPGFTLAASQSALSVTGGQTVTDTLTLTPKNGFSETLAFQCSGLPTGASCSFATPVLQANGTSTVVVTIATATLSATLERHALDVVTVCFMFPFFGLLSAKRRKAVSKALFVSALAALMAVSLGTMTGCGAGSTTTGSNPTQPTPVTSTITITATAQGTTAISHTAQVTLTVN